MSLKVAHEINCNRGPIFRTGFSFDGKILSSSHHDGSVMFWDAQTGASLGEHNEHNKRAVRCLAWNPHDFRIASGDTDGFIIIWDYKTHQKKHFRAHTSRVRTIAWSPDGSKLVSGSSDGYVRTWNALTGELISESNSESTIKEQIGRPTIYSAKWSPCGRYLASCLENYSVIWDAETYKEIKILEGHTDKVRSVTWSKDATLLASCSNDGSLIVWETNTWAKNSQLSIRGNETPVDASIFCVHFSPSQEFIATKSTDNAVRIWRLIDNKCIVRIEELCGNGQSENLGGISFHPFRPTLVTLRNECQNLRIWELDYEALYKTSSFFDIDQGAKSFIINTFSFSPEVEQAGLTILVYFQNLIKYKYPNLKISVQILQEIDKITLKIATSEEYRDFITNEFNTYTQVVGGIVPVENFLDSQEEIISLKTQLAIAKMQIEVNKHLLDFSKYKVEEAFTAMQKSLQINTDLLLFLKDSIDSNLKDIRQSLSHHLEHFGKTENDLDFDKVRRALEKDLDKALSILDKILISRNLNNSDKYIMIKNKYTRNKYGRLDGTIDHNQYEKSLNETLLACLDFISDLEDRK